MFCCFVSLGCHNNLSVHLSVSVAVNMADTAVSQKDPLCFPFLSSSSYFYLDSSALNQLSSPLLSIVCFFSSLHPSLLQRTSLLKAAASWWGSVGFFRRACCDLCDKPDLHATHDPTLINRSRTCVCVCTFHNFRWFWVSVGWYSEHVNDDVCCVEENICIWVILLVYYQQGLAGLRILTSAAWENNK